MVIVPGHYKNAEVVIFIAVEKINFSYYFFDGVCEITRLFVSSSSN